MRNLSQPSIDQDPNDTSTGSVGPAGPTGPAGSFGVPPGHVALPTATSTGIGDSGIVGFNVNSNDAYGSLMLNPLGSGILGLGDITLTFGTAYSMTSNLVILLTQMDGTQPWTSPGTPVCRVKTHSVSAPVISWANSGAALLAGESYLINYLVIELPAGVP